VRRRDFLAGSAALPGIAIATAARAQQVMPIGWLSFFGAADAVANRAAFLEGMAGRGLTPGRDFRLIERYGDESVEQVDTAARELGALPASVIVSYGPAIRPLIDARLRVPVVFAFSGDPIDAGFAASLARPDRNATGVAYLAAELNAKRLELLNDILPAVRKVAILSNPLHPGEQKELSVARDTAARLGIALSFLSARDSAGIDAALGDPVLREVGALIALSDILTLRNRARIIQAATALGLPVISGQAAFAAAGCLFSYGPNMAEVYRRLAAYAERIGRGAAAADLPIEQPTRFELLINQGAALRLGIAVPAPVLARADEVIE
jgi:putative ABC transport system substrate-binding protein